MTGRTISHYRIVERLGDGGVAMVFKAVDVNLDRQVVLKILPPEVGKDEEAKSRFLREAKAISALDHPNICTFYGLEQTTDGELLIAMAHYEGENLRDKMKRGPMPYEQVADITNQICKGLSRVHQKGIVHRNLKPANIFITTDGIVKILDFALAKLQQSSGMTRLGPSQGTPAYMSPEQFTGGKVDQRADIWSLGAMAYEMITARKPFEGEFTEQLVYQITQSDPPLMSSIREDVPPRWEQMVRRALAKNAYQRYQHVEDLLRDLQGTPSGGSGSRPAVSTQPKLQMGYVLFTDLVGYSKMATDAQAKTIEQLVEIVRTTEAFKRGQESDQLVLLPTGDGMALTFFDSPTAPVECAVEISKTLKAHPNLPLRMGIHSGPVYRTLDIKQAANVAGSGINLAQRIMDCGDGGHILVSKSVAEILSQLSEWRDCLHDLGEQQVKHGVTVEVFNLCGPDFGKAEIPAKIQAGVPPTAKVPPKKRSKSGPAPALVPATPEPQSRSSRLAIGLALGVVVAMILAFAVDWKARYCELRPADCPLAPIPAPKGGAPEALKMAREAVSAKRLDEARRLIQSARHLAPSDVALHEMEKTVQQRLEAKRLQDYAILGGGLIVLLGVLPWLMRRPAEGLDYYLEMVSGQQEGLRFRVEKNFIRIGAQEKEEGGQKNDLVVGDPERLVSRFHCQIRRNGDQFFLMDPGSANGTFVDGKQVEAGKPVRLTAGSKVDLAHRCTLRLASEPRKR